MQYIQQTIITYHMNESFLSWAYNRSNPANPKYSTTSHALYITISGTILFLLAFFACRSLLFAPAPYHPLRPESAFIALFYFLYLAFMLATRFLQNGPPAIYQFLWACNLCMMAAAIGLMTGDPQLVRVALVAVSLDQMLWYIDLGAYLVIRKFPIGVAKYIVWPQTSRMRLATTFHHLWFLPVSLSQVWGSVSAGCTFDLQTYLMSGMLSLILALIGRISTPKYIEYFPPSLSGGSPPSPCGTEEEKLKVAATHTHESTLGGKSKSRVIYMNLNISWELWKDVHIGFLDELYRTVPSSIMLIVLSLFWSIGNLPGFLLFSLIQYAFY